MLNLTEIRNRDNKISYVIRKLSAGVSITFMLLFNLGLLTGCDLFDGTLSELKERLRYRDEEEGYVIEIVEEELPQSVITISDEEAEELKKLIDSYRG